MLESFKLGIVVAFTLALAAPHAAQAHQLSSESTLTLDDRAGDGDGKQDVEDESEGEGKGKGKGKGKSEDEGGL
jgi:hypothetical protein